MAKRQRLNGKVTTYTRAIQTPITDSMTKRQKRRYLLHVTGKDNLIKVDGNKLK